MKVNDNIDNVDWVDKLGYKGKVRNSNIICVSRSLEFMTQIDEDAKIGYGRLNFKSLLF